MNKTTFLLIFALLTTQHTHVKSGIIVNTAGAVVVAAAAIYAYIQLKESQKSDAEKHVDSVARTVKNGVDTASQTIKDLFKK